MEFEKLRQLKDKMEAHIFDKRRHLGCEFCGTTFYGYYTKEPINKRQYRAIITDKRCGEVEVYIPPCPDFENCGMEQSGIYDAKTALHHYNKVLEKDRKAEAKRLKKEEEYRTKPYKVSKRLTFSSRMAYDERLETLSSDPNQITKYEMMCDYFLDQVFWKKFGSGCHDMKVRNFSITKKLFNGTYKSNSGKSTMGHWTPYFIITNEDTGKVRSIGDDAVLAHIDSLNKYGKNRRNDPKRNWGLPE